MTLITINITEKDKIAFEIGGLFPLEIKQCILYAGGSTYTTPYANAKMTVNVRGNIYLINLFNDKEFIAHRTMRLRQIIKSKYVNDMGYRDASYVKWCLATHLCRSANDDIIRECNKVEGMCRNGLEAMYKQCRLGAAAIKKKEHMKKIILLNRIIPWALVDSIVDYMPDTHKYKPKQLPKAVTLISSIKTH